MSEGGAGGQRQSWAPYPSPGASEMSHCNLFCPFYKHGGFSQSSFYFFLVHFYFLSHVALHSVLMDFTPVCLCYSNWA